MTEGEKTLTSHGYKLVTRAAFDASTDVPAGVLTAILPITARDCDLIDDLGTKANWKWNDLPVGSFSESGTNINTTVLTIRKPAT